MRLFVLQDKDGNCVYRTKERVEIQIIENQDAVCFNDKEYFWEVEKINKTIEKQNIERFNKIKNKLENSFSKVENVSLNFKSDKLVFNRDSFIDLKTETLNIRAEVKDNGEKLYVNCFDIDKYKEVVDKLLQEKDTDNTNLYELDEEEVRGILNAPAYICHLVDQRIVDLEEIKYSILECMKKILPMSENQLKLVEEIYEEDVTTTYELVDKDVEIDNVYFTKGFYTVTNNPTVELTVHNGQGKVFCSGEYKKVRDIFAFINDIMQHTSTIILNRGFEKNTENTVFLEKKIG